MVLSANSEADERLVALRVCGYITDYSLLQEQHGFSDVTWVLRMLVWPSYNHI